MRSIIYTAGFVCFATMPTYLWAQQENSSVAKTPKWVLGLQSGTFHSTNNVWNYYEPGFSSFKLNGYVFARYHMGKHFAIEAGFNRTLPESMTIVSAANVNGQEGTLKQKVNTGIWSVPLQIQYHMLEPESKIRPYFGLGMGMGEWRSHSDYHFTSTVDNETGHYTYRQGVAYIQFTQGVTWQINKNLQFNQSLTYKVGGLTSMGLNIGLGYTINKK